MSAPPVEHFGEFLKNVTACFCFVRCSLPSGMRVNPPSWVFRYVEGEAEYGAGHAMHRIGAHPWRAVAADLEVGQYFFRCIESMVLLRNGAI